MVTLSNLYQSEDNYQTGIRVEHALIRSFPDRFLRVAASAFYGIIELTGSVQTLYDKSLAIEIAERVPGVTTVVESLRIANSTATAPHRFSVPVPKHQTQLTGQNPHQLRWNHD